MTATWALKPWQEHTMTATWALKAWKNSQQAQVLCCKLSSSTATGLLQGIVDFFLFAQEDFCLAWPLWSPHFLVFALALDMAFLVLPWPLLVWPLPFMAAGWVLAAGFLAADWALAFWSWSWSQLMEHGPTQPKGIPSCHMASAVDLGIPQQRLDLVLIWLGHSRGCTGSWLPHGVSWLPHGHGCWH